MATTTPIHQLPQEIWTLARGFAAGDENLVMAILLRNFEHRTYREIQQATGVLKDKVSRLSKGFSELCKAHLERRADSTPEAA